eukprot:10355758-Heterocapsa_arctica.AAC.1
MGCNLPTSTATGGSDPPGFCEAAAAKHVGSRDRSGLDKELTLALTPLSQVIQLPISTKVG